MIAAAFALALLLQADPQRQTPAPQDDLRVLGQSEIVLEQYRVQHADPKPLYELVRELAGRSYFIREHGGFQSDQVANLRLLGDSIVLYDTAQQVQRVRELLARLDVAGERRAPGVETREYAPKYLSIGSVYAAVRPMVDVSALEGQGEVVLRGSPASVADALALLERLDRPDPQVMLTCRLIEVSDDGLAPALPAELVDNLQKLLPGSAFSQVGFAMLKTSVGGGPIALEVETKGKRYVLHFTPAAHDASSGALTAQGCTLVEQTESGERELFRTDTVLRAGEHTVLAATGATPRLLVLRVTPQP